MTPASFRSHPWLRSFGYDLLWAAALCAGLAWTGLVAPAVGSPAPVHLAALVLLAVASWLAALANARRVHKMFGPAANPPRPLAQAGVLGAIVVVAWVLAGADAGVLAAEAAALAGAGLAINYRWLWLRSPARP